MKKKFYVAGIKTIYYAGEYIEASSEEVAEREYESAIKGGLVEVKEVDLDISADEEEEVEDGEET